jgi:hypothetical protein
MKRAPIPHYLMLVRAMAAPAELHGAGGEHGGVEPIPRHKANAVPRNAAPSVAPVIRDIDQRAPEALTASTGSDISGPALKAHRDDFQRSMRINSSPARRFLPAGTRASALRKRRAGELVSHSRRDREPVRL